MTELQQKLKLRMNAVENHKNRYVQDFGEREETEDVIDSPKVASFRSGWSDLPMRTPRKDDERFSGLPLLDENIGRHFGRMLTMPSQHSPEESPKPSSRSKTTTSGRSRLQSEATAYTPRRSRSKESASARSQSQESLWTPRSRDTSHFPSARGHSQVPTPRILYSSSPRYSPGSTTSTATEEFFNAVSCDDVWKVALMIENGIDIELVRNCARQSPTQRTRERQSPRVHAYLEQVLKAEQGLAPMPPMPERRVEPVLAEVEETFQEDDDEEDGELTTRAIWNAKALGIAGGFGTATAWPTFCVTTSTSLYATGAAIGLGNPVVGICVILASPVAASVFGGMFGYHATECCENIGETDVPADSDVPLHTVSGEHEKTEP